MSRLYLSSVTVGQFFILCACCAICFSLGTFGSQALAQTTGPIDGGKKSPPVEVRPSVPARPGGVTLNDFQPLVDLIMGTIDTDKWTEGGGAASIQPYAQGVFADAEGTLRFELAKKPKTGKEPLADFVDDQPIADGLKTKPPVTVGDAVAGTPLLATPLLATLGKLGKPRTCVSYRCRDWSQPSLVTSNNENHCLLRY